MNLTEISLRNNDIKAYGCKLLAKKGIINEDHKSPYTEFISIYRVDMIMSSDSQWGKLMYLNLSNRYCNDHYNRIGSQGYL